MTGFARTEGANDLCTWVWEAKSVNAKGLDARVRVPGGFEALESVVRDRVKKTFRRGNITIGLNVNWQRANATYQVNMETLERLLKAVPEVEKRAPGLAPATMDGLLSARGVVEAVEEPLGDDAQAALHDDVMVGFQDLVDALVAVRENEGGELSALLCGQIDEIEALCRQAEAKGATQPEQIKSRLHAQVRELCDAVPGIPEERLAQEAAMLMLKADIREELDRLSAHLKAARELMQQNGAIGRQFDFLCQEFNREANTLCSKSSDVELTQIGLALKTVIDQMREQVQNVE